MPNLQPLQTTWRSGIDFDGLNKEDREQIRKIGFNRWLDSLTGTKVDAKPKEEKPPVISEVKGQAQLGVSFLQLARKNSNVVTYDQAAILCPKYPGDPVAWARQLGASVKTDRKNKRYVVEKYA